MKRFALAAAAATLLGFSPAAFAEGMYIEGFGGVTMAPDLGYGGMDFDMDTGYNIGGSLGTTVNGFNVEGEVFYSQSDYSDYSTNINGLSLMVNGLYGFQIANTVEGYVGAGLGGIRVEYDGANQYPAYTGDEWAFGWQLMAGVLFPLSETVSAFGEYRYQQASDVTIKGVEDIEYAGHHLSIGLRAEF